MKTGVTESNRALAGGDIRFLDGLAEPMRGLFFDPQTSGGLLISLPAEGADALVASLRMQGVGDAALIGEVFASDRPVLEVLG